jgi:hypothetical protein
MNLHYSRVLIEPGLHCYQFVLRRDSTNAISHGYVFFHKDANGKWSYRCRKNFHFGMKKMEFSSSFNVASLKSIKEVFSKRIKADAEDAIFSKVFGEVK